MGEVVGVVGEVVGVVGELVGVVGVVGLEVLVLVVVIVPPSESSDSLSQVSDGSGSQVIVHGAPSLAPATEQKYWSGHGTRAP